ncbi:probable protein phosphatase 2C T23F11.1 [Phlebotomus argentipes]|uniref:probable protein phosphatase 2C T23F11.1 n=1 Tax=Phlebotomus argentipes TaxID=94469 RepID=UPI002892B571|nr:probable protein phosphatase 2C T23F11.1 [Phlebotomus argentipes]
MGLTLSEPVTNKESAYCQNEQFRVGSSCMQGWRVHMEDSHTHILSLPDDPEAAFFAVYDGHGGANVAQYAGKHLHKFIVKRPEYEENPGEAMKQAFLDIDDAMLKDEKLREQMAGSTAVAILVKNDSLFCANAGDSRAVACINGKVEVLSIDHKPNNEREMKRIFEGGGFVEYNRVNGNLALSRALGDFVFKKNTHLSPEDQIVTAYPDVEVRKVSPDWEFAVLACDGIWDVLSNEDVVDFCRQRIALGLYPEEICEQLMTRCLAPDFQMGGLGGDNMTAVLVCFLHGKTYEDLQARCSSSLSKDSPTQESEETTPDLK